MLSAHGLTVRLPSRALLLDVSLAVLPGELMAILGENGAGKSTLLKQLAGDRPPPGARVDGDVMLADRQLRDWSLAERARLRAVLPQRSELAFSFSAREIAAFGRYAVGGVSGTTGRGGWLSADEYTIADAALQLTDALHLAHRDVTTLSGGEQARVHLAAVFAQLWERESDRPRFLLLDEPTAALDLAHQHYLLAAAREFAAARGIGIVAVLHDLNLAAQYADRVVILLRGQVLRAGAPRDVLDAPTIGDGFAVAANVLPHPLVDSALIATAARSARLALQPGSVR
jgi:iron complex transport system ATP-binding protein